MIRYKIIIRKHTECPKDSEAPRYQCHTSPSTTIISRSIFFVFKRDENAYAQEGTTFNVFNM